MFKRIFALLLFTVSVCSAEEPRLFLGVNLGASLSSIKPKKQAAVTPLTLVLGGSSSATVGSYNSEAYLETSEIVKNNIMVLPTIGMTFPVMGNVLFEGSASLDSTEKDYTVSNKDKSNKVLAEITRDIGFGGSIMLRISKQYAMGPLVEGHIITSKSPIYTSAEKHDYHTFDFGLQSVYTFHRYFALGMTCTTALDQEYIVKDPDQTATTGQNDITLKLKRAKVGVSLRLTPV